MFCKEGFLEPMNTKNKNKMFKEICSYGVLGSAALITNSVPIDMGAKLSREHTYIILTP